MGQILYKRYLEGKWTPKIDILDDWRRMNGTIIKQKITGALILGGGFIKHHVFNANLMKNGSNYCVIVNTGE